MYNYTTILSYGPLCSESVITFQHRTVDSLLLTIINKNEEKYTVMLVITLGLYQEPRNYITEI